MFSFDGKFDKSDELYLDPCNEISPAVNKSAERDFKDHIIPQIDELIEGRLLADKVFYKKYEWANQIAQTCLDTDFQSTTIQLHYGLYATKINIINFQYRHKFQIGKSFIGQGQFGKICLCRINNTNCAVKLIKFDKENFFVELRRIYKEYFIALLASQLQIGPKIIKIFEYELVFFKNFAIFGMELCDKFACKNQKFQLLEKDLKILHSLHIVHRDIKPQNLAWSYKYQKYVFIDFGLSLIIKQVAGTKTLTTFAGSYSFCCPEMKKYFLLKQQGEVDLYKNDLYGLEECKKIFMSSLFKKTIFECVNRQKQDDIFFLQFQQITRIKKIIYQNNYENAYLKLVDCSQMLKSYLHIVRKSVQKNMFPKQKLKLWQKLRKKLRKKIISRNFLTSENDQIIVHILQQNTLQNFWSHLLLSEKHIKNLQYWSDNQMWLERLYFMFNPNNKLDMDYQQLEEKSLQIINRIYVALKLPCTNILTKKVRCVLLFFKQKFIKFKKINILQSLRDCLFILGDRYNAMKINQFILQSIKDPIEYYLQNLNYYLMDQQYFYSYNSISQQYLSNIRNQLNSNREENNQNDAFARILLDIIRQIQSIRVENKDCYQYLNKIDFKLSQLHELIQMKRSQFVNLIDRIYRRFIHMYNLSIKQKIIDSNTQTILKNDPSAHISQLQTHSYTNLTLINRQFYKTISQKLHKQFYSDVEEITQYLQFCLQMGRGYMHVMKISQCMYNILPKFKDIAVFVQKWLIRSAQVQLEQDECDVDKYQEICWQVQWNLYTLMFVLKQKNNKVKWPKQDNERQYFQLLSVLNGLVTKIIEKYQKHIQNKEKKLRLSQIIKLQRILIKSYHIKQQQQQKIIEQLTQTHKQLQTNKYIPGFWNRSTSIIEIFLCMLAILSRVKVFVKQDHITILDTLFISVYNRIDDYKMLIVLPDILQQFIKIKNRRKQYIENFNLLQNIVLKTNHHASEIYAFAFDNIMQSITTYRDITPRQQMKKIINNLHKQQKQHIENLIQSCFGSYLIFHLIIQATNQQNTEQIKRYLYQISAHLHNHKNIVRRFIVVAYYSIFFNLNKNKDKKRKKIICLRAYNRCLLAQDIVSDRVVNFLQLRFRKWPFLVKNLLMCKIREMY